MRRLLAAYDLSEPELEENIGQCRAILSGAQPYTLSENPVEALTEAKLLTNNIRQWQAINTSVFWHVLASVDQISSYALLDIPFIEDMCNPLLSDGLGLVRYLRSVADSSDGHQSNATSDSNLGLPRPDEQPTLGKHMAPCGDEGKSHAHSVMEGGVSPTSLEPDKPELQNRYAIPEGGAPAITIAGGGTGQKQFQL